MDNDYKDYDSMNNIELLEQVADRLRNDWPCFRSNIIAALKNGAAVVEGLPPAKQSTTQPLLPGSGKKVSVDVARSTMGRWFISVEEAAAHLNIYPYRTPSSWLRSLLFEDETVEHPIPDKVKQCLELVPYDLETLERCKESHLLVPSFPRVSWKMLWRYGSIEQSREFDVFFADDLAYAVSSDELLPFKRWGWHLVRRRALEGSVGMPWADQRVSVPKGEYVPSVAELLYVASAAFYVLGETLYEEPVRCSDVVHREVAVLLSRSGKRFITRCLGADGKFLHFWRPGVATAVTPLP